MSASAVPAPSGTSAGAETAETRSWPRSAALYGSLVMVLAVAAYTRLWRLDLIEFKADEAQTAALALDVLAGKWPVASIATSVGPFNPPLVVYLFALGALVSRNPLWMGAVQGLLGVLAVLVVFLSGRRFFNARTGLVAALCFAADAYAAVFARKMGGTFLEPFFAALLLAFLLAAVTASPKTRLNWAWGAAIFAWALLLQLHYGALLLGPVLGVLFAGSLIRAGRDAIAWLRLIVPALLGSAAGALLFAPYVAYELRQQPDFVAKLLAAAAGPSHWDWGPFRFAWTLVSSPAYGDVTGPSSALFNSESSAGWVTPAIGVAAVTGLLLASRRWRDPRCAALAVFVLAPLILIIRHAVDLQIHYFLFLEPALFLLAGLACDWVMRLNGPVRAAVGVLLAVLLAVQVLAFNHFTEFLGSHSLIDSYGAPLGYQVRLYERAAELSSGRAVLAAVAGRDQTEAARYLLADVPTIPVDATAGLLLPAVGAVYTSLDSSTPDGRLLSGTLAPLYAEPLPGDVMAGVYLLPPDAPSLIAGGRAMDSGRAATWRNGMRLEGVQAPAELPGVLAALWGVTQPVDGSTVFFNQLRDADGKPWFDRDSRPADAARWAPGDSILVLVPAELPAVAPRQAYDWLLGMYQDGGRRIAMAAGASELDVARLRGGTAAAAGGLPAGARLPEPLPTPAVFGGSVRLDAAAVDAAGVSLRWTALRPPNRDFTVFVHALDGRGVVVGQNDSQPRGGRYPTSLWAAGESVTDRVALAVPPGAEIEVGLYELSSGARLRLPDGSDRVLLPGP